MRVIIAGSRDYDDWETAYEYIKKSRFVITEVVNGMARGVDKIGLYYAIDNKLPVKNFPADWDNLGVAAGPIRNAAMAEYADAAIIIINSYSKGAMNMWHQMSQRNKRFYVTFLRNGVYSSTIADPLTTEDHKNDTPIDTPRRSTVEDDSGLFRFFESTSRTD